MSFVALSVYIWLGNTITMSKLVLTEVFFRRICLYIGHLEYVFESYFRSIDVFERA